MKSALTTRILLAGGVTAGPLYVLVAAAQAVTREGFDFSVHAVSLLSNGDLGWIQITNLILAGALAIAGAVGARRTLRTRLGGRWGPRLIGIYGLTLIAAGLLVADPALGFPPGTPDGPPVEVTWQGVGHFVAGGIGFPSLVAACFVFANHVVGNRSWVIYSRITGVVFLGTFTAVASSGGTSWANLGFAIGVLAAWTWLSLVMGRILVGLRATTAEQGGIDR